MEAGAGVRERAVMRKDAAPGPPYPAPSPKRGAEKVTESHVSLMPRNYFQRSEGWGGGKGHRDKCHYLLVPIMLTELAALQNSAAEECHHNSSNKSS